MMKIEDFNTLKRQEKFWTVTEQGVFLMNREEFGCAVFLFAVGNFFVEVWFDNSTYFANHMEVISDSRKLGKYLDLINISDLNPLLK